MTIAHKLVIEQLSAGYGEKTILNDVNLDIMPGKITSIVGANACGKSTLLRTLARLLSPTQGHVLLDGKSVYHSPTRTLAKNAGLVAADTHCAGRYHRGGSCQPRPTPAPSFYVSLE